MSKIHQKDLVAANEEILWSDIHLLNSLLLKELLHLRLNLLPDPRRHVHWIFTKDFLEIRRLEIIHLQNGLRISLEKVYNLRAKPILLRDHLQLRLQRGTLRRKLLRVDKLLLERHSYP